MAQGPRRQGSEGPRPGGLYLGEGVRSESRVREAQASATSPYRHASALIQGLFRAGAKALTATQTVREHPSWPHPRRPTRGREARQIRAPTRQQSSLWSRSLLLIFSQPASTKPSSVLGPGAVVENPSCPHPLPYTQIPLRISKRGLVLFSTTPYT